MKSEIKFIELDATVSTNSFLANYQPAAPAAITVVTAEYQSAGRGQARNTWESEKGKNLLFSILVQPDFFPASHAFLLSEAIALSIRDTIASIFRSAPCDASRLSFLPSSIFHLSSFVTVKWPNDIYVGNRKIAGILIENTLCGRYISRSVIGCGVNINQQVFLSDAPNPVSCRQLIGHDCDRRSILDQIIDTFCHRYESLVAASPSSLIRTEGASLHASYLASLYRRSGLHPYYDAHGVFDAEIVDVEPSGHLVLRDVGGALRRYAFKEVEYIHTHSLK